MRRATVHLEVPFHDVDVGGIAWHGHFFKYFELARTELLRQVDLDVPRMLELGVRVVVTDSRCRHKAPLRYGDRFAVHAWFADVGPAVRIGFQAIREDGVEVARGHTVIVAVDEHATHLTAPPPALLAPIRAWQAAS